MGWDAIPQSRMRTYSEIKQFIQDEFKTEYQHVEYVQLFRWNEIYAAINTCGKVSAVIILYTNKNNEFRYKVMHESMGPYYNNANKKLLNMLSNTEDELSINWREHCKKK